MHDQEVGNDNMLNFIMFVIIFKLLIKPKNPKIFFHFDYYLYKKRKITNIKRHKNMMIK